MRIRKVALQAGLFAAVLSLPLSGFAQTIHLTGDSFTESTDITGTILLGRFLFQMAANNVDGEVSGPFADQIYGCLTSGSFDPTCSGADKTLHQVGFYLVAMKCLAADPATHTVWFTGKTIIGRDNRQSLPLSNQEQQIIANGDEIVFGRFQDTNGDGTADSRGLVVTSARRSYPNADTTNGSIDSVLVTNGPVTAASFCNRRDSMYLSADYIVIDGVKNLVQWLMPDDVTPLGQPFVGSGQNLGNPPLAAQYSISGIARTLNSQNLLIKIK